MQKLTNYYVQKNEQHPFHLVDASPWPVMTSIALLSFVLTFVNYFHFQINYPMLILHWCIFCFYLCRWFSDIVCESTFEGYHTFKVQKGIRFGMLLFIASEVMFVRYKKVL